MIKSPKLFLLYNRQIYFHFNIRSFYLIYSFISLKDSKVFWVKLTCEFDVGYFRNDWNLKSYLLENEIIFQSTLNRYFKNYVNCTLNLSSQSSFLLDLSYIKFFNRLKIIIIFFKKRKKNSSIFYFRFFLFKSIDAIDLWGKMTGISRNILLFSRDENLFITEFCSIVLMSTVLLSPTKFTTF